VGLFGVMAYLSIGFSTYSLARRYAWPPTAFTVTLIVLSMPRIVLLSTTPGIELLPAALSLFCLLAIYRIVEKPNMRDLVLLILGILFSISGRTMCLAFPSILCLLSIVLLSRRHGIHSWWNLVRANWRWVPLMIIPVLVFSQSWLFTQNIIIFGSWLKAPEPFHFIPNTDGLHGATANLIRYFLESAHFTLPFDRMWQGMMGFSLIHLIEGMYALLVAPVLGDSGAAAPYQIFWVPNASLSWFGPFGFILFHPALLYALYKGPRRLKAIALALVGYLYILALIPSWKPGNANLFMHLYVCGGFFIAFFLPPWRFTKTGKFAFQIASVVLFLYTITYNTAKPMINTSLIPPVAAPGLHFSLKHLERPVKKSIWARSRWGLDRHAAASEHFGDNRVNRCASLLQPGTTVGLVYKDKSLMYPFLLACPENSFTPLLSSGREIKGPGERSMVYLLYIDTEPETSTDVRLSKTLWQAESDAKKMRGRLLRIENHASQDNAL
jgi:hypothetical protein